MILILMEGKKVIGAEEDVTIRSASGDKIVRARIDTGARLGSIDTTLVAELGLGPIIRTKKVKSAEGKSLRPVIRVKLVLAGEEFEEDFTIKDRSHMSYPVLIGRNILQQGFIIDPNEGCID